MLQNPRFISFTDSELLRENEHGEKLPPSSPHIRVMYFYIEVNKMDNSKRHAKLQSTLAVSVNQKQL